MRRLSVDAAIVHVVLAVIEADRRADVTTRVDETGEAGGIRRLGYPLLLSSSLSDE